MLKKNNAAIINQIEILRQHLEKLILNNNFTDPEVLATSQALDEALNKFQRTQSSINDNP
ncbi:MAG TPA: aspartyl-phosphate phosphatase Spo0E family protein [Gelria sp.]|nr:aspartyl-phosphate phosphatase Spo0E family protein [Gelria sp.]